MKISVFYDHIVQAAAQTGKPLAELLNQVRNAGIEAVEINMTYLCEHEQTYELLANAQLQVSCVYEFYEMDQKDESQKAKRHIDTAHKAGAGKVLVVPGFLSDNEAHTLKTCLSDYDRTADFMNKNAKTLRMAEGLTQIVTLAQHAGIVVTLEDFDDEKSPLSCTNGLLWFLKRVPHLKATFDTGNFIVHDEDVLEAWELLKGQVAHVHCKDRAAWPVAVGQGYIPMREVIRQIQESGYEGYLVIEHFDAENQEICMANSAAFLRKELKQWSI